jgi:DNA-binding response OmpR family regulator
MPRSPRDHASDWNPPLSAYGSALVALDDGRALFATTLVLQEMGLTVDLASDLESALEWIEAASYEVVVCAGRVDSDVAHFVRAVRYLSRDTEVLVFAEAGLTEDDLRSTGATVLQAPVDVNRLVARLRPLTA